MIGRAIRRRLPMNFRAHAELAALVLFGVIFAGVVHKADQGGYNRAKAEDLAEVRKWRVRFETLEALREADFEDWELERAAIRRRGDDALEELGELNLKAMLENDPTPDCPTWRVSRRELLHARAVANAAVAAELPDAEAGPYAEAAADTGADAGAWIEREWLDPDDLVRLISQGYRREAQCMRKLHELQDVVRRGRAVYSAEAETRLRSGMTSRD
jgi:hypothetical protein